MNIRFFLSTALLAAAAIPAHAVTLPFRANIYGNAVDGKCTIEVDVDGAAEIEVFGDRGLLHTLSGQTAVWRRFECNGVMPSNPGDFRFSGVDGRGTQTLLRDPRHGGGRAVVRIDDPKSGREGYTFDLEWHGGRGGAWGPGPVQGYRPGPVEEYRSGPAYIDGRRYGYDRNDGRGPGRAINVCESAVTARLERDGYGYVQFVHTDVDDDSGRNNWIVGTVEAQRGRRTTTFGFSCSVDFNRGVVTSVDVGRRR